MHKDLLAIKVRKDMLGNVEHHNKVIKTKE